MQLHVDVVSAEGEMYSDTAEMVFVAAEEGDVGIAARHAPLLTRIKPGQLRIKHEGGGENSFFVSGGMLEVQPHLVTVMADTVIRAEHLDEAAADNARQRAEEAMRNASEPLEIEQAQRQLTEAAARQEMLRKLRGSG